MSPLIKTKATGIVSTAPDLPTHQNLQVLIPFADAMLLNRLVLKRQESGVRSSKATKAAVTAEAIRRLAEAEGISGGLPAGEPVP
jgi:hypothetical protein